MKVKQALEELESRYDMYEDRDWRGLKEYISWINIERDESLREIERLERERDDLKEVIKTRDLEDEKQFEALQSVFRHGGS